MNLTTEDILAIIDAGTGRIESFKITKSSLEIVFAGKHKSREQEPLTHHQGTSDPPYNADTVAKEDLLQSFPSGQPREQVEEQELIEELFITQPSAFEDLVTLREIKNGGKEEN